MHRPRSDASVPAGRGERGQLLIVGALAIAVTVIGFALLINGAAFTDPGVSQGSSDASWQAIEFRDEVDRGVGEIVRVVNVAEEFSTYATLNNVYMIAVADWSDIVGSHQAAAGGNAGTDPNGTINGSRITQNVSTTFRGPDSRANWTLVNRTNATRQFRLNVTNTSLVQNKGFGTTAEQYRQSIYFRINLTSGSGSTNGIYVYRNASGERVFLRVDRGSDTMSERCAGAPNHQGEITIYLTEQQIGTNTCRPLRVFDGYADSNYTIEYGEGDEISGTYELIVDQNRSRVREVQRYAITGNSTPFVERAIYAGRSTVGYAAPTITVDAELESTPFGPIGLLQEQNHSTGGENVTFLDGGDVMSTNISGTVRTHPRGGDAVTAIGPWTTFDDDTDGLNETSFVVDTGASEGNPSISDSDGGRIDLATGTAQISADTTAGFGRWDGGGPFVLYIGDDGAGTLQLRRADPAGDNLIQDEPADGVTAIGGSADIDATAGRELVFTDGDDDIRYFDGPAGSYQAVRDADLTVGNGGVPAIGTPADFDEDGTARIPFVNASNDIVLANAETDEIEVLSVSATPRQAPVASVDWTGDGTTEIVFINDSTPGTLHYVDGVESGGTATVQIRDQDGNLVQAGDPSFGVR